MDDRAPGGARTVVMLADVDLDTADGARTHVLEVAAGFARAGRDVVLVARGSGQSETGFRYRLAPRLPGRPGRIAAMNIAAVRTLLTERSRSGLLYYRFDPGMVGAVVLARALGYRIVGEVNNLMFGRDFPEHEPGWFGALIDSAKVRSMAIATRVTHHLLVVTEHLRSLIVRDYRVSPRRVHVLPNGVDTERFKPLDRGVACRAVELDPSCNYIVFVGLLADWVDFRLILEGFASVAVARSDARMVVIGDGPERATVDRLVHELALTERVICRGAVYDRDQVAAYLGCASVCVAAYRGDMLARIGGGSPLKLLEYMAAGRPIVAAGGPEVAAFVAETGGGIAVSTASEFARGVGRLLDDPVAAGDMGQRGRRAVVERHGWDAVLAEALRLLDPEGVLPA